MPLPGCLGYECGGEGNCGRSAWGERILTLDQFAKESQQPKLRACRGEIGWRGRLPRFLTAAMDGEADVVPDPNWSFGCPDAHSQLQALMKEHQAAARELLAGQAGLLKAVRLQHRELCERLERQWPTPGGSAAAISPPAAKVCEGHASGGLLHAGTVNLARVQEDADPPIKHESRLKLGKFKTKQSEEPEAENFMQMDPYLKEVSQNQGNASGWVYLRLGLTKLVLHSSFELVMGFIIVLNFVCVFLQMEWKGMEMAYLLGYTDSKGGAETAEKVFQYLEMAFCLAYLFELMAHICVFGVKYLCTLGHFLDSLIVLMSCADAWIFTPLSSGQGTFVLARLVRLVRISRVLRAVKVFRFMTIFKELRVMITSFISSVSSLLWSMLFITFVIIAGGVLMVQLCLSVMEDETASLDQRKWVFEQFGTAMRASWSMFEATFTTGWPAKARPMIMEVSPWFAIFWVFYTVVVNFAVMRVIAALFLKHTLAVSNSDEERMSMEKMAQKEAFAAEIHQIFQRGDKMGDGVLAQWEFDDMMKDPEVLAMFKKLDLSPNEIHTLFRIVADQDGVADYEEFLDGALKMKSSAQRLDMIEVLHEQLLLRRQMEKVRHDSKQILRAALAVGPIGAGRGPPGAGPRAPSATPRAEEGPGNLDPAGDRRQDWEYRDGEVAVEEDMARLLEMARRDSKQSTKARARERPFVSSEERSSSTRHSGPCIEQLVT